LACEKRAARLQRKLRRAGVECNRNIFDGGRHGLPKWRPCPKPRMPCPRCGASSPITSGRGDEADLPCGAAAAREMRLARFAPERQGFPASLLLARKTQATAAGQPKGRVAKLLFCRKFRPLSGGEICVCRLRPIGHCC
jgi:hypothetical protein